MLSGRGERFTAETWLRRNGLAEGDTWPRNGTSADGSLRCEARVCTYRRGLWRVSIVRSEAAVAGECRRPDVLISTVPVRERCAEPRLLLDRTDFWREGAHALRFLPTGIELQTARGARGNRRWVPQRGAPVGFER